MRIIKLMPDYYCHPLWEGGPDLLGNIDPHDLPLSDDLLLQLTQWAEMYDATLNLSDPLASGFPSLEAEATFKKLGYEIAKALAKELGNDFTVTVQI